MHRKPLQAHAERLNHGRTYGEGMTIARGFSAAMYQRHQPPALLTNSVR
jgi:hypothetical protein